MTNLHTASNQWATRPAAERFLTLQELDEYVRSVRDNSADSVVNLRTMSVESSNDELLLRDRQDGGSFMLNHWSTQQLATMIGVPMPFMRKLGAERAASDMTYVIENGLVERSEAKLLFSNDYQPIGRALTGPRYGRIWDAQMTAELLKLDERTNGRFTVPTPFRKASDALTPSTFVVDKNSTTLYASDRDMFAFLVDEDRPINIPGSDYPLFRGFYAWNSETGKEVCGIATFLYSYVCANRIIWGATGFEEKKIRHSAFAPERFSEEMVPIFAALAEATEASTEGIIASIQKARRIAPAGTKVKSVQEWLEARGFSQHVAVQATANAEKGGSTGSDGDPTSLWGIVQGLTAYARNLSHQDDRVDIERRAGSLMKMAQ